MDIEVFALYDKYGDINLTIELFRLLFDNAESDD